MLYFHSLSKLRDIQCSSSAKDYTNITICVVFNHNTVIFISIGKGGGVYKKKSHTGMQDPNYSQVR